LRYGGAEQQGVDAEAILGGDRLFFDSLMMRGVVEYNQRPRQAAKAGSRILPYSGL
jgi:hypothetical protein